MIRWKTYEDQARLSVALAAFSFVASLAAITLVLRNFDPDMFFVNYRGSGPWLIVFGVGLLIALGAGTLGFLLGIYTAGQNRNKATNLSWMGFFGSAVALTMAMSTGVFFYFTRNAM